jgi:hypothetical protein
MKWQKMRFGLCCYLLFFMGLCTLPVRGQDEPQQQPPQQPQQPTPDDSSPKPAARSIPAADQDQDQQNPNVDTNAIQPDETPLTGLQDATVGLPEIRHSYWVPGVQYGAYLQSNPYGTSSSGWYAENYVAGNLTLLEAWPRSTLSINYSGGAFFSTNSSASGGSNGSYQELSAKQHFRFGRWLIQLADNFSYLPQTSFGFGGGTNLGVPGVGGSLGTATPGLGSSYIPNQSIYGVGPAYSNAGLAQITYAISPRSSITASGSYGFLNYINPGNINTNSIIGGLGYNYAISKSSTIGLVYFYSSFQYPGLPEAYGNHVASVAYGRNITGRLALRLMAGPQISTFRIPIANTNHEVGEFIYGGLTYALKSGSISAYYNHSLNGGSGVLVGSTLDQVSLSFSHRLTQAWSGNLNFGYAHNGEVASGQIGIPTYDSWYAGGGLSRPIGRNMHLGIAYMGNIGSSHTTGCTGTGCSSSASFQTVTVSIQWHTRPFVLR